MGNIPGNVSKSINQFNCNINVDILNAKIENPKLDLSTGNININAGKPKMTNYNISINIQWTKNNSFNNNINLKNSNNNKDFKLTQIISRKKPNKLKNKLL